MSATSAPLREPVDAGGFGHAVRAEWTKFRTVRAWMIGLLVAVLLGVLFTFLVANGIREGSCTGSGSVCQAGHPFVPTGPGGEAVADSYQFVGGPLTGNGTITARVTALTGVTSTQPLSVAPTPAATRPGLAAWAKAGILLTPTTRQGSPYAAVMATGRHGIRFQYDYSHDRAGRPGAVSGTHPQWLRLTRSGDMLTSYDSSDGTTWTKIGTARLAELPATVDVGLFVTSPVAFHGSGGAATRATARFDHVTIDGHSAPAAWGGRSVGTGARDFYPVIAAGSYRRSGGSFALSGSGDIAPAVVEGVLGTETASSTLLLGLIVALIAVIVVAATFITAEYRRGLIRTTFTATPSRVRVLAAKAAVVGAVAFATGAATAAAAVPLGEHILTAHGVYVFPASALAVLRIIAGSGALVAVTAVAVLAVGTIARTSAGAVTAGIVVFLLPYFIGSSGSGGAGEWLFRVTPAAGFAVLGALPRSGEVSYPYTLANGYYPLAPWAGLIVLFAYAALALGVAAFLLERRDA